MCLSTVTSNEEKPTVKGVGWKYFEKENDGRLIFPHYPLNSIYVPSGWIKSHPKIIETSPMAYTSGFHVFSSRSAVKTYGSSYIVRKVLWEGELARGEQHGDKCVVVSRMRVLSASASRPSQQKHRMKKVK